MKVRISFTVEVDTELWQMQNGEMTAAEIREDVRSYVEHNTYDSGSEALHPVQDAA